MYESESRPPQEKGFRGEYENLSYHPYNVGLALLLFSLTILFLTLTVAFVYTRIQSDQPPLQLPYIFLFNTVVLLASSYAMHWANRSYQRDDTAAYQKALWATIGLSIIFLVLQFVGWKELFEQSIFVNSDNSSAYLYIISALHFLHVIAGLPFLAMFLKTAQRQMKEPVSVLVYFSDPDKRLKLRLLTVYWHFLDALWIYLVLFFFINALIR